MTVQWFPGHMHKARLEMEALLPKVHLVIEVLDARIPYSSENPLLAEIRGDKPCLKLLSKSDLADDRMTEIWLDYFGRSANMRAHAVTTEDVPTIRRIKSLAIGMLPERENKQINAMIMGIPNVGKSTIINFLAGKKVAKTGNTPAVTKSQQRVNIGDRITLYDTPGMMWPNVHNPSSGYRLALLGSIKETAMDYAEIGFFAARFMLDYYPKQLTERYNLDEVPRSELEAIEAIGRKRGCLGKSNVVDIDRASRILVTELRQGVFGLLTLESPEIMEKEKAKTAAAIAAKNENASTRDARRKQKFVAKQKAKRESRERR
ncbi:MAG: ribosome biogenesis GTPase YlqF [Rubripirellula sp.]